MNILFEDNDIVVCIKPYGVLSQTDKTGEESAVEILQGMVGGTVYPVHRLDRTTEGIMVFAKTKNAAAALSRAIAEHKFKKTYLALVHGKPTEEQGKMEDLLFFDRRKNKSYTVKRERAGVKKAVLEYRVINTFSNNENQFSCLEIKLQTGRTHQIRVQCASRGLPIVGDRRYGAKDNNSQIALYSARLAFTHPKTDEEVVFDCTEKFLKCLQF